MILKWGVCRYTQKVAMLTHTPGLQVGLYKAHSGIKWWSSEKLEPRIPPCVNVPFVVWWCQRSFEWLYEMVAVEKCDCAVNSNARVL